MFAHLINDICTYVYTCMYICIHVCMYAYIRMHVYGCICSRYVIVCNFVICMFVLCMQWIIIIYYYILEL